MAKEVDEELQALELEVARAKATATASGETVISVDFQTIRFVAGRFFVIADLEPLQFFHLVEHIGPDGVTSAISRLYERLSPLLTCNHQWTELKRTSDTHVGAMLTKHTSKRSKPQVCRLCTAYVFADSGLPIAGRSQNKDDRTYI